MTFNAKPSSSTNTVTVTATPTSQFPNRTPITYSFTVGTWFTMYDSTNPTAQKESSTWCAADSNRGSVPIRSDLTGSSNAVGESLWGEWGDISAYSLTNYYNKVWTPEVFNMPGYPHYYVDLTTGKATTSGGAVAVPICKLTL